MKISLFGSIGVRSRMIDPVALHAEMKRAGELRRADAAG
jgi:hypothetical protein